MQVAQPELEKLEDELQVSDILLFRRAAEMELECQSLMPGAGYFPERVLPDRSANSLIATLVLGNPTCNTCAFATLYTATVDKSTHFIPC